LKQKVRASVMNTRQDELLKRLLERGRLSVDELVLHFAVSGMTVRRDLGMLESQGLLTRTHGGCVLRSGPVRELPFQEKVQRHPAAKEAIARAVVGRLSDGDSLYLDTGTTCAAVARLLPGHRRDMRVFSNNLPAVLELFGSSGIEVVVPGGALGHRSPDLTGGFGLEALSRLCFDTAVVGADAFDPDRGEFYSADLATAALSRAAQERAAQTFVCIDGSKFGKRGMALAGCLREGAVLVTDAVLSKDRLRDLRRSGAEILMVAETAITREDGE
jgi:DeoR family transcriptional regulator of aga operon